MKTCKFCGHEIPQSAHDNRDYCNDHCYYLAKLERNKENYAGNKKKLMELKRVESVLRMLYQQYSEKHYIEAALLNERGMNWSFFSGETTIENLPAKIVGDFAYCLFKNQTVRIWKL